MAATPEESDHTGAKDRIDDLRISMGTTGLTAKSLLQQLWDFGAPHSGEGSVVTTEPEQRLHVIPPLAISS